jgi:Tn3 transposase DDE domain-containing protein
MVQCRRDALQLRAGEPIDRLVPLAGVNRSVRFDLIETPFRHLMRVAVSIREGAISSFTLLKRLRSGSREERQLRHLREVGRVIRTVQLLRYLSDAPLRRRVTVAWARDPVALPWIRGFDGSCESSPYFRGTSAVLPAVNPGPTGLDDH